LGPIYQNCIKKEVFAISQFKSKFFFTAIAAIGFLLFIVFSTNTPMNTVMATSAPLGTPWTSGLNSANNSVTINVNYQVNSAADLIREIRLELRDSSGHTVASATRTVSPGALAPLPTNRTFSLDVTGLHPNRHYTVHATSFFANGGVQQHVSGGGFRTDNWIWNWGHGTSADWIRLEPVSMGRDSVSIRVHAWGWGGRPSNWSGNWHGWDSRSHGGDIREVGAVMSRHNNPRLGSSDSRVVQPSSSGTVTFRNLQHNTVYYVRGFVTTNNGSRFYGPVYTFRAGVSWQGSWDRWDPWSWSGTNLWAAGADRDRSFITTNQPIEVNTTTVRISSHIPNRQVGGYWSHGHWNQGNWNSWDNRILERGFVWSDTNRLPTLSNSSARQSSSATGTFEMTLTGLAPGTTYHVSAFYRTPSRTFYGNVVTVTTPREGTRIGDQATVSVTFRNLDGRDISTTNVPTTVGSTLNATNLNIPTGYTMWPATWSYVVTGSANIVVVLAPVGHVPPTVQPAPTPGGAFFPARGNFTFAPEAPVSRGELAQAIFNLYSGSRTPTGTAIRFNDTVGSQFSAAIDFVTAMGYMNGYPDGSFRPTGALSRAEAATVLSRIYGLSGTGSATFSDLPAGHWARNYVALSADRGIFHGYPDGTFGPNRELSRAESVALLVRADGRNLNPLQHQRFSDVPEWHWAFNYIMSASVPR